MSVHYDLPKRIEADLALMAEKFNITSFKMSPSPLCGGKQTTTAGEHISQLVVTRS